MADNNSNPQEPKFRFQDLPRYISIYVADVLDLKKGVNAKATIQDIKNKRSMSGANAWMLMCSIVIASIGLSQDNQAVIIGAMLISPLMSPILGIGLSVGINDMDTLRSSLAHFAVAIFIAVFTSYIYFEFTPFQEITKEISNRTKPTFLDIFIAIFGGLAGIISIARKDISTTLPGVAIATALMPPLCVTGYGLAQGDFETARASFYLFFLNTFFVALATYLIVRFLRFPYRKYVNQKAKLKNRLIIVGFSLALAIPSYFIFQTVKEEIDLKRNVQSFVDNCLGENKKYLDDFSTNKVTTEDGTSYELYLKVYGDKISRELEEEYLSCLDQYTKENFHINILSTSDVQLDDVQMLEKNLQNIAIELENDRVARIENEATIVNYKEQVIDTSLFNAIKNEVRSLYPDIETIGVAKSHISDFTTSKYSVPTVFVTWNGRRVKQEDKDQLKSFLKTRMKSEDLELIHY